MAGEKNRKFAEALTNLMERRELGQEQLAAFIGVGQSSVSNYLRGRVPRTAILQELARFFGVTVERLLSGGVRARPEGAIVVIPKGMIRSEKKRLDELRDRLGELSREAEDLAWLIEESEYLHKQHGDRAIATARKRNDPN